MYSSQNATGAKHKLTVHFQVWTLSQNNLSLPEHEKGMVHVQQEVCTAHELKPNQ